MIANGMLAELFCAIPLVFGLTCLISKPRHCLWSAVLFIQGLLLVGCAAFGWSHNLFWQLPEPIGLGSIPMAWRLDKLSAVFLFILGIVTTCCALFSPRYLEHLGDKISGKFYWSALFLFVGGMAGVILADNAVIFLVCWEIMSLSSATLVTADSKQRSARQAAMIYLVATRIATALLSGGFLIMYAHTSSWVLADWHFTSVWSWYAAALILGGLCIKAGVWPFHIWLPYAHPEAPTPVSALMSGVMVKVPIYALLRFFVLGQLSCPAIACVIFVLACISAFSGVLFALNQRKLKRLLAYSTVENIGLILIGASVCLWSKDLGLVDIAQLAFMGAILHCVGHGMFKSLLFLCAGSVDYAAHTREFRYLGGLSKAMPWTCLTFIVGSASICALPPLNGFASKWYLYQALLHAAMGNSALPYRAIAMATIGIFACIGALSVASFVKAVGLAFLGGARSSRAAEAREVPPTMVASQMLLAAACVVMGVITPQLVDALSPLLPVVNIAPTWVLQTNVQFAQMALVLTALIACLYLLVLSKRPTTYITWDCGFGPLQARMHQATSDSFAEPITRIFAPLLRYTVDVAISGSDRRHFPEHITVEPHTVSLLETRIYKPLALFINRLSGLLAGLQAGSIHLYLMYVCITLVLVVFVGTQVW